MANERNNEPKGCLQPTRIILTIVIIFIVIVVGYAIFDRISENNSPINQITQASMSDIDGNWTQSLFSNTYTFIPSKNINGLILQFEIYNDSKLVNTIVKTIGDVKRGQQYTVTLTADEYLTGNKVKTSVKSGTISLF